MWLLKFLFTGRRSFIVFAFLAFVMTLAYLAWHHRYRDPVVLQQQRLIEAQRKGAERLRQMHRGTDKAIRDYQGPHVPPPKKDGEKGQQR